MAGVLGHSEAGSSEAMIEIKIKTMDSQTYTLQVDKQMPVPALKERIASVTGVVMEHQRLICRGKVLKDDQLLSAYHVEDGHTLHLVVREPTVSLSQSLPADSANDQSSSGSRGQLFQIAPGIVVETFNLPRQGDRGLTDVSRIVSAVLGSIGITSIGNGSETREQVGDRRGGTPVPAGPADTAQTPPEQSGLRSQSSMSSLLSSFGIPSSASFGSVQPPVIPDSLATLSQYLSHMRQEFLNSGRTSENSEGASSFPGNAAVSSSPTQSESALPSLASLAELLSATRQMLNQQTDECLLQLASQLENHENITDSVARANAQTDAVRTGILLQNLGAYFLELGRTVTTLRLGRSSSEAIVNAGPAVFVSPSGPNPLMVQPLPFQPGASFGTPISGTPPSGSSLINGLGASSVPRRIDIQIRRGSSTHQTDPVGSRQSSGQTHTSGTVSGVRQNNQHATGTSDAPSLNSGAGAHVLPFRTVMAAFPDLSRAPQESSSGSLGFLFPFLGRLANLASGNLSSRTESQVPSEHQSGGMLAPESTNTQQNVEDRVENGRSPAASSGERESVSSRTIDINILSAGGMPNDENSEGQIPPSILQFLGGLFPGGEIHVESVSSQETETGLTEQARTNNTVPQEEPMATEEGLFLSRMLQQIMPLISQDSGTQQNVEQTREDSSQGRGDYTSSASAEDSEVGTSRQRGDLDTESPDPKRQKIE